jgi:hypothetical protein
MYVSKAPCTALFNLIQLLMAFIAVRAAVTHTPCQSKADINPDATIQYTVHVGNIEAPMFNSQLPNIFFKEG